MINHYEMEQQARERAEAAEIKAKIEKAMDLRVAAEAVARCIGHRCDDLSVPVDIAEMSWEIEQDLIELIDTYVRAEQERDGLHDDGTEYVSGGPKPARG